MKLRKRCYFVTDHPDECGLAIVAKNIKEAKSMFMYSDVYDGEYIEIRCKWMKKIIVDDLPYGQIDVFEGLKRGVYSYVNNYGDNCPSCSEMTEEVRYDDDKQKFYCDACEDDYVMVSDFDDVNITTRTT